MEIHVRTPYTTTITILVIEFVKLICDATWSIILLMIRFRQLHRVILFTSSHTRLLLTQMWSVKIIWTSALSTFRALLIESADTGDSGRLIRFLISELNRTTQYLAHDHTSLFNSVVRQVFRILQFIVPVVLLSPWSHKLELESPIVATPYVVPRGSLFMRVVLSDSRKISRFFSESIQMAARLIRRLFI